MAMKTSRIGTFVLPLLLAATTACNARGFDVATRSQLPPAPPDAAVRVTWLGTAGVLVSDGEAAILIDPFVSRYGLLHVGLRRDIPPMQDKIAAWTAKLSPAPVSAVIVSHSHYDHAMDAPYFATAFAAPILGSSSTANIALGAGMSSSDIVAIEPGSPYQFGRFTVTLLRSEHGPALLGRIPYPGTIDEPLAPPVPATAYKLGEAYSIHVSHPAGSFLHHGSASWVDGMFEGVRADVVFLGVAGRADTAAYLHNVVDAVGAHRLIPFHYDDFFAPLDDGVRPLFNINLNEFFDAVAAHSPAYTVETLPIGVPVQLFAAPPAPAPATTPASGGTQP